MYLHTPVVPATVASLLPFYGEAVQADSLTVERYPAAGATAAYSSSMFLLQDGRLTATLPDSVLFQIISSRKGWAKANRFWRFVTGVDFTLDDALTFPGKLAVADEVAKAGTYWTATPGRTRRHLAALNLDLVLEVWDPTLGEFVPSYVREAQSPSWALGQTGHGAILALPAGLLERAQAGVDGLLAKAKQALRDELGLDGLN